MVADDKVTGSVPLGGYFNMEGDPIVIKNLR